ncbi:MAG: DUF1877 family protein [Deltaproteobacteria bacterium]|nr:DUF1877 family protein [Deltaproteobacteria bacterium]
MSGRGVLFALDDEDLARLGEARSDREVLDIVTDLEERWENACELDRAWDAIHRALTDGRLDLRDASPPLSRAILGGTVLVRTEAAIVSVKGADDVVAIAKALAPWDEARFRAGYQRIDRNDYGDLDEEDFGYTFAWFERLAPFYARAAREERAIVFAVDL